MFHLETLVACGRFVLVVVVVVLLQLLGASDSVVDVCPKNLVKAQFPPCGNPLVEVG